MTGRRVVPIADGWEFRQSHNEHHSSKAARSDEDTRGASTSPSTSTWRPVGQFPTNVHLDLLHHGLIADPFPGRRGPEDVRWVGEADWEYRVAFATPPGLLPYPDLAGPRRSGGEPRAVLEFEGLDTFARVELNGRHVLSSDNMFLAHRVDVTDLLNRHGDDDDDDDDDDDEQEGAQLKNGENELRITFESAYRHGRDLVRQHPKHAWGCWNGDVSRLGVRKAQYHWGWDWGPMLMTCGPWRPVNLEVYTARIADLRCEVDIADSRDVATVRAHAKVEVGKDTNARVIYGIVLQSDSLSNREASYQEFTVSAGSSVEFEIRDPELWYPARYGKQPLYKITAVLQGESMQPLDLVSKRIGLRTARVVQRPVAGQPGTSFFFEVNGVPVFCGGSNWIPADSFLPRVGEDRYREWVALAAEGGHAMLRVWGGGVYESQSLYDACDELGVLVWQDFMFACGNYPAWPAFLDSVRAEAEHNLRRLRHHPCIVLWAGNNEDYQYAESVGLLPPPAGDDDDDDDDDPERWLASGFPARYIYEKILPEACAALCPDVHYQPGSPWSGSARRATSDPTVGDLHQWNVWHGSQAPYQEFEALAGRFVSEFGMQALPAARTVDAMLLPSSSSSARRRRGAATADPERSAHSATVEAHNKAAGAARRLAVYLAENLPSYPGGSLEAAVYATQLVQAECLGAAYRAFRRQWAGPGRELCAGALVWQLGDCWPATSWAVADYFMRPKGAYFAVKRELAPVAVGAMRRAHRGRADGQDHAALREKEDDDEEEEEKEQTRLEIWASNLTTATLRGVELVVRGFDVGTGEERAAEPAGGHVAARWQLDGDYDGGGGASPRLHGRGGRLAPLPANRSVELADDAWPLSALGREDAERTVIAVYLLQHHHDRGEDEDEDESGAVGEVTGTGTASAKTPTQLARCVNWPEPLKYLHLQARPAGLKIELELDPVDVDDDDGHDERGEAGPPRKGVVVVSGARVPVKGLALEVEDGGDGGAGQVQGQEEARFEDNFVDVVPGETLRVGVRGVRPGSVVRARWLGMAEGGGCEVVVG